MINSRWPRPIGVMASIALIPVCIGSRHRLAFGDPRGDDFHRASDVGLHGAFAVERIAQRIEDAPDDGIAGGNRQQRAERFDFVAFFDRQVVTQNDDTDRVFFEVEGESDRAVGEFDHFTGHDARQAVNAGDTVADFQHGTDFADVDLAVECSISCCKTDAISSLLNFMDL